MSSYCQGKNTFNRTVGAGTFAEKKLIELLTAAGLPARKNPATRRTEMIGWDVEAHLADRRFTLEAKFDQYEARSGNVAIEYMNTKKCSPSGINATQADLWVTVLQDPFAVWVARTADLKQWFHTQKPYREISCGGDDNAAMKLFRREELFDGVPFHRIDDLHPAELTSLLKSLLEPAA